MGGWKGGKNCEQPPGRTKGSLTERGERNGEGRVDEPLNIYQADKILAAISYAAAMMGLAAASLAFVLWHKLLRRLWVMEILATRFADMLPFAGLLFAGLGLLIIKGRLRRYFGAPVKAGPEAALLYGRSVLRGPAKPIAFLALCCLGFFLGFCLPYLVSQEDLHYVFEAVVGLATVGAFCSAFYAMESWLYGKVIFLAAENGPAKEGFDRGREIRHAAIKWSAYWIVVLAGYLTASIAFRNFSMYAFYLVLAAVYFVLRLLISKPYRRFSSIRSRRFTVRALNLLSVVVMAYLYLFVIESGINYNKNFIQSFDYGVFRHDSSFSYDRETGVYTLTMSRDEFRILQLTDLHICGSISTIATDRKAFDACYALIRETQPDLIVITGDLVYPIPTQTFNKDNLIPIYQICTFMNHVGIPWAMVYGNHDTEAVATYTAKELSGIFQYFRQQPDCPMLYADQQPEIYGRYNQYLKIENADGSLNRLIFLVDSNDYRKDSRKTNDYDSVHEDQIAWYANTIDRISEEEGRIVPSFVFMHIPPRAFADASAALAEKDPDAVYLFGENEEKVSCPDRDFGFFQTVLEKQSTEAIFVGHDHLNNMGIKYKGVDLVYSKSIDYYAYPGIADKTKQRGATLIALFPDGTYHIKQVDYAAISSVK